MGAKYNHLIYDDRLKIKELSDSGLGVSRIAEQMGISKSTISRELRRGTINGEYDADYAEKHSQEVLRAKGPTRKVFMAPGIVDFISECVLVKRLSPDKISELLNEDKRFSGYDVTGTAIYNAICDGVIPGVTRESLRVNITTMQAGGSLVIPKWMREEYGYFKGEMLDIKMVGNKIVLTRHNDG